MSWRENTDFSSVAIRRDRDKQARCNFRREHGLGEQICFGSPERPFSSRYLQVLNLHHANVAEDDRDMDKRRRKEEKPPSTLGLYRVFFALRAALGADFILQ